jgi:hypothetical protein
MDLPQTIFLEMVLEELNIGEGDQGAQIRLSKQEWNTEKLEKKLKWFLFLVISLYCKCISPYLVGSDELIQMIEDGPLTHTSTLVCYFYGCFLFHLCLV